MPEPAPWPEPHPGALQLIERIYRFANAMNIMKVDPDETRAALLLTMEEAFALLDHMKGPWRMAVWAPRPAAMQGIERVDFDLAVTPRPGLAWGKVFGVTLIVEDNTTTETPSDT